MPFDYKYEDETGEILFGQGDIGVGGESSWEKSNFDLVDLGQECCIGVSVEDKYTKDQNLEDRRVSCSFPVNKKGLNAPHTFVYQACDVLHSLYSNILQLYLKNNPTTPFEEIAKELHPQKVACLLCRKSDHKSMVATNGIFVCSSCIDLLYNAIHDHDKQLDLFSTKFDTLEDFSSFLDSLSVYITDPSSSIEEKDPTNDERENNRPFRKSN